MLSEIIDDNFKVLREEFLSNYTGDYRVIQYDNGFYALQQLFNGGLVDASDSDEWRTILISPFLDEDDNSSFFGRYKGKIIIDEIMDNIKEADNSFNGNYWMLNLYLSEMGEEHFMEVITKGEGETLLKQLYELSSLEIDTHEEYIKYSGFFKVFHFIICILIIVILGYAILHTGGFL